MPHADHEKRDDPSEDRTKRRVETLKTRVDALESERQQSRRDQQAAEKREKLLRKYNTTLRCLSMSCAIAEGRVEEAYREICTSAAEMLEVARVGIWFFNEDETILSSTLVLDSRSDQVACKQVLYSHKYPNYFQALRQDRTLPADDAQSDERTSELRDDYLVPCGITSMLDAPVRVDGKVVGVICHEHHGPPRQWSMDEQTFAGSMGDLVSLALQAARRRSAEQETEQQRAFLHQIIDITPNLVFVLDRDGQIVFANQAMIDITRTPREELIGRVGVDFVPDPSAGQRLRQMDMAILDGRQQTAVAVEQFLEESGASRWFQISKRPITSPDGTTQQVLGVAVDITARKLYEDRMALLVRELDHRVKNNLFAVMIMAEQSAATSKSMQEFVTAFTGRIRAMAVAHELLAAANWHGVRLPDLIQRIFHTYTVSDPNRVTWQGPAVLLSPAIAPAMCTMLNELVTNAVTHGSLSVPKGTLDINWQVRDGCLRLIWEEHAGPEVHAPRHMGFGTELIERITQHQLRGEAKLRFAAGGFQCELGIPLESAKKEETSVR